MRQYKQFAARIAAVLAAAALVGTSAFAESRPSKETRSHWAGRGTINRDRAAGGAEAYRGDNRGNGSPAASTFDGRSNHSAARGGQTYERGAVDRSQTWRSTAVPNRTRNSTSESTFDRSGSDRYRSNDRSGNSPDRHSSDVHGNSSWSGNNHGSSFGSGYGSHRNGQHYSTHGQVSHVDHYHGGYRVWLGGVPFPFFVPLAYFQSDHFRIGLNVNMGGYYNPLGYYDYDNGYYRGSYYGGVYNGGNYYRGSYPSSGVASAGVLRGVVESVDDRNGTFVIRNDATGSFVTVEMRDRNRNDIRPGDYLQLSGDWSRSGLFLAYDVNMLQADGDYDR